MRVPMNVFEFKEIMGKEFPHIPATWDAYLWNQWCDCRTNDPTEFAAYMESLKPMNRPFGDPIC